MSEVAFDYYPWEVSTLVDQVDSGEIRLPDIQRPFVWTTAKVRDLIDSMYRGYPVGELMFWVNSDATNTRIIGDASDAQPGTKQVIDGQQRLTSLFAVVKGVKVWNEDYQQMQVRIAFNPLTHRFEVASPIFDESPEWISDITTVFGDPIDARRDYIAGLRDKRGEDISRDEEKAIEKAIGQLHGLLRYRFQVVQVSKNVGHEKVADIFVRINSEGVKLKTADFILTWLSVFWEEGRVETEVFARRSRFPVAAIRQLEDSSINWTPHNAFLNFDPRDIVRVVIAAGLRRGRLDDAYNYLTGRDPRTRLIDDVQRQKALAEYKKGHQLVLKPSNWDEMVKVIERAGFRSKSMVTSRTSVLLSYALWLVGRTEFDVPVDELREVMARWLFMAQLTGRYSGSYESQIQKDLNRLDEADKSPGGFVSTLHEMLEAALPPDFWTFTLPEAFRTSKSDTPAFTAYLASLSILDADVLLSTMKIRDWLNPARSNKRGIEKHHLFPKDYLKNTLGIRSTTEVNQVANYAMVEWSDNNTISGQPPAEYWPREIAEKGLEGGWLDQQMYWAALPPDWQHMSYSEFLAARRKLLAGITHEGYKRLVDPSYQPASAPEEPSSESGPIRLPSLEDLVASDDLPAGTLLSARDDDDVIGEVTSDGRIQIGEDRYESPTAASRARGADIDSGWDYWLAHLDTEPVSLAEVREAAARQSNNTPQISPVNASY